MTTTAITSSRITAAVPRTATDLTAAVTTTGVSIASDTAAALSVPSDAASVASSTAEVAVAFHRRVAPSRACDRTHPASKRSRRCPRIRGTRLERSGLRPRLLGAIPGSGSRAPASSRPFYLNQPASPPVSDAKPAPAIVPPRPRTPSGPQRPGSQQPQQPAGVTSQAAAGVIQDEGAFGGTWGVTRTSVATEELANPARP